MPKDDRIRLRHMLDAARDAVGFAKGKHGIPRFSPSEWES
jgi:uncharacterized protein with HEPN domain